jgi:phenylalanyl-tRNA synthetase beta chain
LAGQAGGMRRDQQLRRRAEDALRDLGFDEIVGWSFTDPGEPERLRIPADDPRAKGAMIANPLSEDQSVMRTTLAGSLLGAAQHNLSRNAERVALFESGRVYLDVGTSGGVPLAGGFAGELAPPFAEPHRLGCLAVGPSVPKSWRGGGEQADFFALKAVLEGLAVRLGVALGFEPTSEPFLYPGRAARVRVGESEAGWLGELHPLVCREWDLDSAVGFEVGLAELVMAANAGEETFEDLTTFPAILQDLAVVVPTDVSAAQVRDAVLSGGADLLRAAEIFDLYEGEQLGEKHKSLAIRLQFQSRDRTLTDEEVVALRDQIIEKIGGLGGEMRAAKT